jgi:hypothetical protein
MHFVFMTATTTLAFVALISMIAERLVLLWSSLGVVCYRLVGVHTLWLHALWIFDMALFIIRMMIKLFDKCVEEPQLIANTTSKLLLVFHTHHPL